MNRALILLSILFCTMTASAQNSEKLQWDDLEIGTKYHVTSEIYFPTEQIVLSTRTGLILTEVAGSIGVVNFLFQDQTCTDKKRTAELVISKPQSVGIELLANCVVSMWVEGANYYDVSPLAR